MGLLSHVNKLTGSASHLRSDSSVFTDTMLFSAQSISASMVEATSLSGAELYSPLNQWKDEIRLLTFAPAVPGRPQACTLQSVSLQAFGPKYAAYVLANGAATTPTRRS